MAVDTQLERPVHMQADSAFVSKVQTIVEAKKNIAENFYTIGKTLHEIQSEKLYLQGGFKSFYQFLRDRRIDIVPVDAERFIAITQDETFRSQVTMGLSKMLELMKMEPQQRQHLLQEGGVINGTVKNINDMNLTEMKKVAQEFNRRGKTRCDRCGRWVEQAKEIDGKFYGASGGHSCYESEMEERRALNAGRIPAAQLDTVLNTLKIDAVREQHPEEEPPLQWLPESLYQIYGQLIQDQQKTGGEVTIAGLKQEQDTLRKLQHLCQSRLREIQDTVQMLREMQQE